MIRLDIEFNKVVDCIDSSFTPEHLKSCSRMLSTYLDRSKKVYIADRVKEAQLIVFVRGFIAGKLATYSKKALDDIVEFIKTKGRDLYGR